MRWLVGKKIIGRSQRPPSSRRSFDWAGCYSVQRRIASQLQKRSRSTSLASTKLSWQKGRVRLVDPAYHSTFSHCRRTRHDDLPERDKPMMLEASTVEKAMSKTSQQAEFYPRNTRYSSLMRQVERVRVDQDGFHCVKNNPFEAARRSAIASSDDAKRWRARTLAMVPGTPARNTGRTTPENAAIACL